MTAATDTSRTWRCHGRVVIPGMVLTVRGERGARFRFLSYTVNAHGDAWVDVYGGRPGRERFRSFAPDRVAVVHPNATGPR